MRTLFTVGGIGTHWVLEATLRPRVAYAVVADTVLRDTFGQRLEGNPAVIGCHGARRAQASRCGIHSIVCRP